MKQKNGQLGGSHAERQDGEEDVAQLSNRMNAQSMRLVIGESSAKKEKNFQFIGDVSKNTSKVPAGQP